MIKPLANLLNVGVLLVLIYFFWEEGAPDELWIVVLWVVYVCINLTAINDGLIKGFKIFKMPELVSLYLQRKKLEEKARIKELSE
jgi:hypothetical protein